MKPAARIVFLALLALPANATAQTDVYGDPLPKGVTPAFLRLAPDGKTLAVGRTDRGGGSVVLIDVATGTARESAMFTSGIKGPPRTRNANATFSRRGAAAGACGGGAGAHP